MVSAHSSQVTSFDPKMGKSIAKLTSDTRNGVKKKCLPHSALAGARTIAYGRGLEEDKASCMSLNKKGHLSDFEVRQPSWLSQILTRHTWVSPVAGGISPRAESYRLIDLIHHPRCPIENVRVDGRRNAVIRCPQTCGRQLHVSCVAGRVEVFSKPALH